MRHPEILLEQDGFKRCVSQMTSLNKLKINWLGNKQREYINENNDSHDGEWPLHFLIGEGSSAFLLNLLDKLGQESSADYSHDACEHLHSQAHVKSVSMSVKNSVQDSHLAAWVLHSKIIHIFLHDVGIVFNLESIRELTIMIVCDLLLLRGLQEWIDVGEQVLRIPGPVLSHVFIFVDVLVFLLFFLFLLS